MKFQVLTNGIEVKLQRNALSVIEAPTGNEEDDEVECNNTLCNGLGMDGHLFHPLQVQILALVILEICTFLPCVLSRHSIVNRHQENFQSFLSYLYSF